MSYTNGVGALQQVLSSITPATTQATESAKAQNQGGAAIAKAGQANRADQTSLSSASGMIAQALQGPDVRLEKVAALQQAIASGTYSVSSSDVADKMIKSLLE
ncbi:MAG: flagellar biosynthesis anti-sigma factor FlgM [Edaphobacter sp.]